MQHSVVFSKLKLSDLIDKATKYIVMQGYSESAIRQYTRVWRHLKYFADSHSFEIFSLELSAKFMKEIYGIMDIFHPRDKKERWRIRFIWSLYEFSKNNCFIRQYSYYVSAIPEVYIVVYNLYKKYLSNKKQRSRSIITKLSRIKIFLLYLYNHGIFDIKEIIPDTIIKFIENLKYSSAYKCNILYTLREFLNCDNIAKLVQHGLSNILNTIQSNRYERLPSFFSDEEIKSILLAVNRKTPQGKKDYAIMILAIELGLRGSDIRKLKLDEILWDKNIIELFQKKTDEFVQLHMTENVRWSILDYIMNVRPKNNKYRNVFLRSRAPYKPHEKAYCFYGLINKYIHISGVKIKGRHHGLHSFRHGLATRLMNEGTPITIVSEALGHKSINSTKDYIRINFSQLRLVALEVRSDV